MRREVLDPYEVDTGLLTGDDGVAVSLMPNPYRAAEFARAHNDWLRDRWLDAEPRFRGSIIVPAQDPLAAAAEIERVAGGPAVRGGAAVRRVGAPYGEPRYLPIFQAAVDCGLPVAIHSGGEGMGISNGSRAAPATELLHRVAHAGIGLQHHGAPRVADLPWHVRAGAWAEGADDGGRPRLAPGDHVAARRQLAGPARRGAVAGSPAERDPARAHQVHHAAAGADRWQR